MHQLKKKKALLKHQEYISRKHYEVVKKWGLVVLWLSLTFYVIKQNYALLVNFYILTLFVTCDESQACPILVIMLLTEGLPLLTSLGERLDWPRPVISQIRQAPTWCRRHRTRHNRTPPHKRIVFHCSPRPFVLLFSIVYINCVFYTKWEPQENLSKTP